MRDSSLRWSTLLISSAICSGSGAGLRSSRAKITRVCAAVMACVFFPRPLLFHFQKPQRQDRQRHVVVPPHPTANFVVIQTNLAVAVLEEFLNSMALAFDTCQDL